MAVLEAHGIQARLPSGFEGRIFRRAKVGDEEPMPVGHFATFPLPPAVGDFGSGAVTLMGPNDVFAVLFEYGRQSAGTALFSRRSMPRRLAPHDFHPMTLRRGLGGQSGTQWFFVEQGRPFTLYAVLGSHARRFSSIPRLNALLSGLAVATSGVHGAVLP